MDYILVNRSLIGRVRNCNVIPGECVVSQHRIVVMDMDFKKREKPKKEMEPELTKWWLLKGDNVEEFKKSLKILPLILRMIRTLFGITGRQK